MVDRITGWLDIYEKEIGLFLWTLALLFLVRSSGIILNNYAETAFLKRYGVEFMPVVTMINAVVTVFIMGLMTGLIQRFPGPGLLAAMFVFCGATIFGLRLLIPAGFDLVYPLLFILKALYELLIAMLFWNLANDLFNTRQSKRLFPLISAGGVMGQILGSFGTPLMAAWFRLDNLLVVYLAICVMGAAVVWAMTRRFPSLLKPETGGPDKKQRTGMVTEIRRVWPLMKQSTLLRIMVLLTFMPNVVIPIMNYQFNYAVDSQFVTETGILEFFGYFRGFLNIISLVILLFVGKIYGRWGLPVALMFHPFNYILAFLAFVLRFDAVSAVYARMSTNVIRTTINIPANAVMMGLFPDNFRSLVRPFLRGTVVRIALFLGSGLILVCERLFHPRYLSLVALPFVLAWLVGPFILKRRYVTILLDLVKRNLLDLKSMEEQDIGQLFRDRRIRDQLTTAFQTAAPRDVVWYAQLLQRCNPGALNKLIVRRLTDLPVDQQVALMAFLSGQLDADAVALLKALADKGPPEMTLAIVTAANRLAKDTSALFNREPFLKHADPGVRGAALAGLFALAPSVYSRTIEQWLDAPSADVRLAGVLAAGATGNPAFTPALMSIMHKAQQPELLTACMDALHAVGLHDLNPIVAPLLTHADARVRRSAMASYHITDKQSLKTAMRVLADADPDVRKVTVERIAGASYQDGKTLITALNLPQRHVREAVFELIERLKIRTPDIYRFASGRIEGAYKYLAEHQAVSALPVSPARDLLLSHLYHQGRGLVKDVLRVLEYTDPAGRIRIIRQGLYSADARQRANSQEALNDVMDRRLAGLLLPLLDPDNLDEALKSAKKRLVLPTFDSTQALFAHLLARNEWLTVLLSLNYLARENNGSWSRDFLRKLSTHETIHIRELARRLLEGNGAHTDAKEPAMAEALSLPDILLHLKKIEIFEDLSVSELTAVASITKETNVNSGQIVIREDEPGDTLYLVLEGEVAVMKKQAEGEVELDRIAAGDYFGEMALFEEIPRTASIRTLTPCRMLLLHKHAFNEIVREYPQIALEICKVLSGRIRRLHLKITQKP